MRTHITDAEARARAWSEEAKLTGTALRRALDLPKLRDDFFALTDMFPFAWWGQPASAAEAFVRRAGRLAELIGEVEPAAASVFQRGSLQLELARLAARQYARERGDLALLTEVANWHGGINVRPPTPADGWHSYTCAHCERHVSGAVIGRWEGTIWLICTSCGEGSVKTNAGYVYPSVLFGPSVDALPPAVGEAYQEARSCMGAGAFTACELM